jgi:hypothetical protein
MKQNHFTKISAKADRTVGFCLLAVNKVKVFTLADGEDDSSTPVPVGTGGATGAIIACEIASGESFRVLSNGSTPSYGANRGILIDQDKTVIYIGRTSEHQGDPAEMTDFKAIGLSSAFSYLHVTYVNYP